MTLPPGPEVTTSLYARILRESWVQLAEPIRRLHGTSTLVRAHGQFRIEHGRRRLARVLAVILCFPRPGAAVDTEVTITPDAGRERWQRSFDGLPLETELYEARDCLLGERFGPLEFCFALHASNGGLVYVCRETAILLGALRMRIPPSWAPRIDAHEEAAGTAHVKVAVRIVFPWLGPLITYDGMVEVMDAHA